MWHLLGKISTSIQLVVDGTHLAKPYEVADAFANHFQLVYNDPSPGTGSSLLSPSEFPSFQYF
jgi:hypothetical protein